MMDEEEDGPDGHGSDQGRLEDPDVGYGRPPKATQFKPGQSGNPKGRPPGAKTRRFGGGAYYLRDPLVAEAERLIPVRDGGHEVQMAQMQAIARQMVIKALQGNVRAAELVFKYLAQSQRYDQRVNERFLETMASHKVAASAEVRRRAARGITDVSDILPHPDHIDVDVNTGEILISGPMSPGEAAAVELARDDLPKVRQALEEMDRMLAGQLAPERRRLLIATWQALEEQARSYADLLGEPYP